MAVLIDAGTRPIMQGITGRTGRRIVKRLQDEGSPLLAGVTPGRGGADVAGVPVYDSCAEAVRAHAVNASFVCVPAPFALDAAAEAIEAGLSPVVVYTEGVATRDALRMAALAAQRGVRLIGPNAAGCTSPGQANLADLNAASLAPGRIGVVSKSGTLACEAADDLIRHGHGQSTVVCIGGDPVIGTNHRDMLELFEADPQTDAVVMVGEIGGHSELSAAEYIPSMTKPVIAHIAGRAAPPGKPMGHAGALLGRAADTAAHKMDVLRARGAVVVRDVTRIGAELAGIVAPSRASGDRAGEALDRNGAKP